MSDAELDDTVMLSRRTLIGAASAAPLHGVRNGPASPDDVVFRCREWLAIDAQIDDLSRRWAKVEARMVRDFNWFALPPEERRSTPQAEEMFELEIRLDQLSDERERGLNSLAKLKARDLHGVASKLAVAARLLQHVDGPVHHLITDAINDLAAKCCPSCGTCYATAAKRP